MLGRRACRWRRRRRRDSETSDAASGAPRDPGARRQLLALAESSNVHEAQAATSLAQKLMLKYNLDSAALGTRHGYGFRHLGVPSGRIIESERLLSVLLGEHFFVEVIWVPVYRPFEKKRGQVLEICGTPPNLEMASYVHAFLTD